MTRPKSKAAWLAGLAVDLAPLKASRDYRLMYAGQLVSLFGSAVSYVALPWQMYHLTKSSFLVGMLGVVEFFPMIVLAPIGGMLADTVDRRRIVLRAEVGLMLVASLLLANALRAQPSPALLFVGAGLHAAFSALARPAREAIIPRLLPNHLLPAAAALATVMYNAGNIGGPALAGVITTKFGAHVAFAIDALSYVGSLATLLMIGPIPPPARAPDDHRGLRGLLTGWRYARSRQELLGTYLIDLNAMFFGMPMALFPAIAERFGGSSIGLFYAMPAAGALLASLTSGWVRRVHRHGLAVAAAATAWGVAIVGFGLSSRLWLGLGFLAAAGAADCVSGIFRGTIWNQTIPDRLRGRLAGIEQISYLTGPYLGNAEAGLVASAFGVQTSVVSGGILCVAGSLLISALLPRFVSYDARTFAGPEVATVDRGSVPAEESPIEADRR